MACSSGTISHRVEIARQTLAEGGRSCRDPRLIGSRRDLRSARRVGPRLPLPRPDLVPVVVDEAWRTRSARASWNSVARQARFQSDYGLSDYDATVLTGTARARTTGGCRQEQERRPPTGSWRLQALLTELLREM